MKPPPFAYARATALDEAWSCSKTRGRRPTPRGRPSLIPLLAFRLARPTHVIDIARLPGLDAVDVVDGGLRIGTLVTHAHLERSVHLPPPWRALTECAGLIGHYPIRVRGTVGGSLAHADPAAELPVVTTALEAVFVVRSRAGSRRIQLPSSSPVRSRRRWRTAR